MRRRWLWIGVLFGLSLMIGGWFAFQPRPHQARIITLGDSKEEYLALEPGSVIVLEFAKPVPTEAQRLEIFQELLHSLPTIGHVLDMDIARNTIILKVDDFPGASDLSFRTPTGEWYKLKIYILDVQHYDEATSKYRSITHSRPLPRDGTVPIGQGTFKLRIRSVSLAESLTIAVRNLIHRMSTPLPAASSPPVPIATSGEKLVMADGAVVETHYQWSRHGKVLRLQLILRNQGKKPVRDLRLIRLQLGKQSPRGVQFPYQVPVIEPGQSQVLTFDFPNGDAFSSLAIGWDLLPAR
jgi:hypothetical protein